MTYVFNDPYYIIRLERGESLLASLQKIVREQTIPGAIISGIGGAERTELGYYNLEKRTYEWRRFDELMEITSLQGNLAWQNEQPKFHLHATISNRQFQAFGGHVRSIIVGATCEIILRPLPEPLRRGGDMAAGLDLLQL